MMRLLLWMQMRINFVNDHDAWLFGQIRRIAVVWRNR